MNSRLSSVAVILFAIPLLFVPTARAGDDLKPLRIHILAGGEYDAEDVI